LKNPEAVTVLRSLGRFAEGTGYMEAVGCVDSALSLAGHRSIPSVRFDMQHSCTTLS